MYTKLFLQVFILRCVNWLSKNCFVRVKINLDIILSEITFDNGVVKRWVSYFLQTILRVNLHNSFNLIISRWRRTWPLILTNMNVTPLHSRTICVRLKLAKWFCRERFSNSVDFFFAILLLSPFGQRRNSFFYQTLITLLKDDLCHVWSKSSQWIDKNFFICHFSLFVVIFPWNRTCSFILINMNPFKSLRPWSKCGLNSPSTSG